MRAIIWLASIFTILGVSTTNLFQTWESSSITWRIFLLLTVIAALGLFISDLQTWWKNRPKGYKKAQAVNKYMLRLLKRGGSMSIFANHLSWIRGSPAIRDLLVQYARNSKDVRIYVPRHNELTRALSQEGVRILTYESIDCQPEARFTLLNPDEPGSSLLAIGKGTFPKFYVEEFPDITHSRVISVARDLLHIIDRLKENGRT